MTRHARRLPLWTFGLVTASASLSAVALGQQASTWGSGSSSASPAAGDAGVGPSDATPESGVAMDSAAPDSSPPDTGAPSPKRRRGAGSVGETADASAGDDGGSYTPGETGFSVGVRGAYMLPFGQANGSPLNGTVLLGAVGVGVDAGWFFSRHFYVGGYFQYGFGIGAGQNNETCSDEDVSCTATVYRFGLVSHWHFKPGASWDPWIGGGLGYELVTLTSDSEDDSEDPQAANLQGLDLTLELGIDFKPLPYLGLGPYAELATGPYLGTDSFGMHGWASFGVRFRTNL